MIKSLGARVICGEDTALRGKPWYHGVAMETQRGKGVLGDGVGDQEEGPLALALMGG